MKRLVCEMCGSNDLVKQDGLFVCQSCGTKYSLEEAKKMMFDGPVEVKGSVSLDTSKSESSLLSVIETAIEAGNYEEVYEKSAKLVEMNDNIWQGWLYKGLGAGFMARQNFAKFNEMVACYDKAYKVAPEQDKLAAAKKINEGTIATIPVVFKVYADAYENNPNEGNANRVTNCYTSFNKELNELIRKYNCSRARVIECEDKLCIALFDASVGAKQISDASYGRKAEERSDYKYDIWLAENANIINVLMLVINTNIRPENVDNYFSNIQKTIRSVTHSCSYEYSVKHGKYVESKSLKRSAVKEYNTNWEELNARRETIRSNAQKRMKEYQAARNSDYWGAHQEEKTGLESEKDDIKNRLQPYDSQIAEVNALIDEQNQLLNTPIEEENAVRALESEREQLKEELRKFSLFDIKGKKPIKEKISELDGKIKTANDVVVAKRGKLNASINQRISELNTQKASFENECAPLRNRVKEIDNELIKNR